jgi:hypothetical protein
MVLVGSAHTKGFYLFNVSELAQEPVDEVNEAEVFVLTELQVRKLQALLNSMFDLEESERIARNAFWEGA